MRLRHVRRAQVGLRRPDARSHEYGFLVGALIDTATLRRAEFFARRWQVSVHEVLIAQGWVSEPDYVRALAEHLKMTTVAGKTLRAAFPSASSPPWPKVVSATLEGQAVVAIEARSFSPGVVAAIAASAHTPRARFVLASRQDIASSAESQYAPVLIDKAVNGLWRDTAELSARTPHKLWQPLLAAALSGLAIGSILVAPELAAGALAAILAVPFLCVVLLRAAAVIEILRRTFAPRRVPPRSDKDEARLPVYSILIPLHREAEVLADLVHGLAMLDYPAAKLQILLVLESDDADTRRAAAVLDLPGNFEIVVVPDRGPRTKPKALNYALGFVRGEFVAVYDAEDIPEPDQLRRALAIFRRSGPNLACIQARLNIYNPDASWLTRQFTLEYSALFDAILPALQRLGLPVPLGGTSNHFRTALLRRIGAWDPYNVTEDADLGIRIARAGLTTATLDSTTWEEAPIRLGNWLTQRTRWIKGWQTYLVHTRQPIRLLQELGLRQWVGLHVLMGGILLSVLMHPLSYLLLAFEAANGRLFEEPGNHLQHWLWWVAVFNLGAGYASAMIVGVLAAVRRGRSDLAPHVLLMPVYWLLISFAGYRALIQLARAPHLWEKTQHGAVLRRR